MSVSNIIDRPRPAGESDLLDIDKYTDALVKYIETCRMPTTLAIQGEWGSGKTSLLNQIRYQLCEDEDKLELSKEKPYYGVWVNTWQYSLMKSKDETLISIIKGLTTEIMRIVNRKHHTKTHETLKKVGQLFGRIATIGAKAAISTTGIDGDALVSGLLDSDNNTDSLIGFKNALSGAIKECLEEDRKSGNNNRGFIFFIDDLDRIDPPVAVEILELIKNIFEVDNCIFILAIDYEVVVKGLVPKFGPLTDKNEREFRSFFDKIIQLPFSMPVSNYNVTEFLINSLIEVGYLNEDKISSDVKSSVSELALLSVGTNPRSLKRLINTLSLLKIIRDIDADGSQSEEYETLINFGLVCAQIAYPKLYGFLIQEPDFKSWDDKTAKKYRLPEINDSQQVLLDGTNEFDEEWEKVLFRLCVVDSYLSSKVFQISQFFNYLAQLIPEKLSFGEEIQRILGFSAVTSVNIEAGSRKSVAPKFAKVRFDNWNDFEKEFKINRPASQYLDVLQNLHDFVMRDFGDLIRPHYGPNTLTFDVVNKKVKGGTRCFLYITFHKQHIMIYPAKQKIVKTEDLNEDVKVAIRLSFNNLSSIPK
jgi:hypothetical protein